MKTLLEDSKRDLIAKSKRSDLYGPNNRDFGKNRHQRRLKSRIATSVAEYNKIDMNKLFKENILQVNIRVNGETDVYLVTINFDGFLDSLRRYLPDEMTEEDIEFKVIQRALLDSFNHNDVKVHCTCPDYCLEENTLIKLLNGDVKSISEILKLFNNNEELWVYSVDSNGDFKPGKVTDVWISNYVNDMIKVVLDNDQEIITTPNHRYMLRDGSYIEASQLVVGQSLMPLYFSHTNNGYETVKLNSKVHTSFYSTYKLVANDCLNSKIQNAKDRSGEDIIVIHHKDFNKQNNYPSNLFPMGKLEHWKYHYEHLYESGVLDKFIKAGQLHNKLVSDHSTEEYKNQAEICSKVISNYWNNMTDNEYKQICSAISRRNSTLEMKEKFSKAQKKVWDDYSKEEYANRCKINKLSNSKWDHHENGKKIWESYSLEKRKEIAQHNSESIKQLWKIHPESYSTEAYKNARKNAFKYERTPEIEQQRKISKIKTIIQRILDNNEIPSPETYDKYRTNGYPKYTTVFNNWDELSEVLSLNHKVKNIEYIHYEDPIPVYDLTVEKYNNFYVDAGVILHNCYRQAYWATVNGINAGAPENRPSDETNPDDTKGAGCKHINLVLNNNSWMMKVASVVTNYIKYMRKHYEKLYADVIYPAIFEHEYEEPVQMDMFNEIDNIPEDEVPSNEDTIDISNKWARTKNQFKPGNKEGIRFSSPNKELDIDSINLDDNTNETTEED